MKMQQKVLTYAEFEALGYTLYQDYRAPEGPGSILQPSLIDVAYRADSKEEFLVDFATGVVKTTVAISTGGLAAGVKTGLTYFFSLL